MPDSHGIALGHLTTRIYLSQLLETLHGGQASREPQPGQNIGLEMAYDGAETTLFRRAVRNSPISCTKQLRGVIINQSICRCPATAILLPILLPADDSYRMIL